ncbi:unnamed protein product [Rotaria sp. Silwood1]|nr:unnamed protein product [Rotaria sp. Silwood1]
MSCLSVAVDVFTLVCISVERYLAICHPLLTIKLQSLRFTNFLNGVILFLIWILGLLTALPNISIYNLCSLPQPGRFKCEKVKPQDFDERLYMVALDVFYFLVPMLFMLVLYTLIICKIYRNNTATKMRNLPNSYSGKAHSNASNSPTLHRNSYRQRQRMSLENHQYNSNEHQQKHDSSNFELLGRIPSQESSGKSKSGYSDDDYQITSSWPKHVNHNQKNPLSNIFSRQTSKESKRSKYFYNSNHSCGGSYKSRCSSTSQGYDLIDRHRRKALKLLIVIIVEFFICWTPLFIYHTFGTFDKKFYRSMPSIFVDLILLFSFASLLCNPFTYYFMSKRYRMVLYAYLSCCCCCYKVKPKFSKKNQAARKMIQALHLHQQQNSLEYKQKINKYKLSQPNYIIYQTKFRSNTVQ